MSKKKTKFKIDYNRVSDASRVAGLKMLCKACNALTIHGKPKNVGKWVGLFCVDCGVQSGVIPKGGAMTSHKRGPR